MLTCLQYDGSDHWYNPHRRWIRAHAFAHLLTGICSRADVLTCPNACSLTTAATGTIPTAIGSVPSTFSGLFGQKGKRRHFVYLHSLGGKPPCVVLVTHVVLIDIHVLSFDINVVSIDSCLLTDCYIQCLHPSTLQRISSYLK
jgi:hypothetical protein